MGLELANSEVMLGGLIGDSVYYGVHRAIFGKTDAASMSAEAFWWGAGKLGWAINTPGLASRANDLFGTSGHSSGIPIKLRMQINGSWWAHEYWSAGNNRLKSYGSFQLKTKNGRCLNSTDNTAELVQADCTNADGNIWMAKPIGDPQENTYQLRSKVDNRCMAIDGTTVSNWTKTKLQTCNNTSKAQKFKFRRLSDNFTLTSVLNDSKCFDDEQGSSGFHMWDCNLKNQNQYFRVNYVTGIDNTAWSNLKSANPEKLTIRTKDATSCIGSADGSTVPVNSIYASLEDCDTNLSGNNSNQTFYLVNKNDGYYKILASDTNPNTIGARLYLGVRSGTNANDGVLDFRRGRGGDTLWRGRDWQVLVQDDGSVKFKNRASGKCMQHKNGWLEQYTCKSKRDGDANQKFVIHSTVYNSNGAYD
jgi:hypothetical protein